MCVPSATHRAYMKLISTEKNLYVFSGGEGFVVLPAYDNAPAVLAYSDNGQFDPSANPALAEWMAFYNSQLEYLKKQDAAVTKPIAREAKAEIAPLIATEWNQESPYNELCPKVDGHETVTGCVATAMAQAMKYYNYPVHGKGKHSYMWRPGEEELSFDYETTTFEWDLMTDRYDRDSSEASRLAVARLMLGCGISVDMHYEPGGSGAATTAMGTSLIDIFGYSPSLWMPNRAYYGYYEWEDMIYSELKAGHPVLYSGAGTDGGHQFICDGYRSDGYFHFNWGWGGLSNGYFLLTALNPDDLGVGGGAGGFNTSQIATLGLRPAADGDTPIYLFYNNIAFTTDVKTVKEGDAFRCAGQYFNYSLYTMPEGSRLGMRFKDEAGTVSIYAEGPGVEGFHPDDGRNDLQVLFPELPDGTYKITPALRVDDKWYDVRMPVGCSQYVTAVVKNGIADISDAEAASVTITDITVPTTIYADHELPLIFKAVNTSNEEYYSTVTPYLLSAEGKEIAKSTFRPLDVMPGGAEAVTDYIAKFSALKGEELSAGEYELVFRDESGKTVSAPISVTVAIMTEDTEFSITEFHLEGDNPVAEPDKARFGYDLRCTSGVYFSEVTLRIFPGDGGDELYHQNSDRVYLTSGESRKESIAADLSELKDGEYMALIYDGWHALTDRLHFRIDRVASGLKSIDGDASQAEIYDLYGRKVQSPSCPGIYIVNGTKTLVR